MRSAGAAALLLVLSGATALAQTETAAQLEARLPTLAGTEKARALARLAKLLESEDPKRSLVFGQQALEAAPLEDRALRADILAELAWAQMMLSQYPEAVASGEESVRLSRELRDE